MKKISFFATLVILTVSAALVMAGGHSGMKGEAGHHGMEGEAGHGMEGEAGHGMKGEAGHGMKGEAGHHGMKGEMGHGREINPFILSELDLTMDQTEQIGVLSDSFEEDIAAIQTQLSEKRAEMNELWTQTNPDAQAVKAKEAEIHALKGQIQDKNTDHRLAVREVLTSDQLSELIANRSLRGLSGLDLTPEQTDAILSMRESLEDDITPLRTQVTEKHSEMRDLWNQTTPDVEAIKALQTEIHELKGEIHEKHTDFRLAVREVLTPEQLTELVELRNRGQYPGKGEGAPDQQDRGRGMGGPRR
ncbi:periplasmic heavy metal sensor [Desulfobacterales bacterium HSG2]|nr:periplasmic heavy metal sensor [Desulfobacterales bacterium HSG2]